MELLEKTILEKGIVLGGNVLKVGSFLNNQIDIDLMDKLGKNVADHFAGKKITKVLTVEASGIAFGCFVASHIGCNLVFAKKSKTNNVDGEVLSAPCFSYTHQINNNLIVPKEYILKDDKVLLIDDFLAHGEALFAMFNICKSAGAEVVGAGIAIEKGFQKGGARLRDLGIDVYSLAVIEKMETGNIQFKK